MIPGQWLCYRRDYPPGKGQALKDWTITPGKSKQKKNYAAAIEDC
jgi:hypothetical protein